MRHDQKLINSGICQGECPVGQGTLLHHVRGVSCVGLHLDDLGCCQRQTAFVDTLKLLYRQEWYPALNHWHANCMSLSTLGGSRNCLPGNRDSNIVRVKEQRPRAQS